MRVRTCGLTALALGILIGAGGCTSDSPTSPLAPSAPSADKGGIPSASAPRDTSTTTVQGGGYIGGSNRQDTGSTITAAGGGYIGGSN